MWERQTRPWFISPLIRKHCEEWLVVLGHQYFFAHLWQHKHTIRQAHACIHRDRADRFACYICKTASSCGPADQRCSSVQTCVGDRVSFFYPPNTPTCTLPHPLSSPHNSYTCSKAAAEEKCCVCRKDKQHTVGSERVEKGGEGDGEGPCVCVCLSECVCVRCQHIL